MAAEREPCWTNCVSGSICHRGGLGCPRPHADDPPELRTREARNPMHYDPVVQEAKQAAARPDGDGDQG